MRGTSGKEERVEKGIERLSFQCIFLGSEREMKIEKERKREERECVKGRERPRGNRRRGNKNGITENELI